MDKKQVIKLVRHNIIKHFLKVYLVVGARNDMFKVLTEKLVLLKICKYIVLYVNC